jgi:TPR repeat protein
MNIPVAISGRSEVEIALMSVDGRVIAEARTSLIVAAPTGPETTKREAPVPSTPAAQVPTVGKSTPEPTPAEPSLEKKGAQELLALGERYLAQGKVGGARLFFRQAAEAGNARAAMRLAATYDAAELAILKVQGIAPDALEARKWYERARELGATEAEERLARLGDK